MSEEKFVTIPFKVWEEKYKPMEARNRQLQEEVDGKRIDITLYVSSFHVEARRSIGFINVDISGAYTIRMPYLQKEKLMESVREEFHRLVPDHSYDILTRYEAYQLYNRLHASERRWEEISTENKKRIAGIPWIIKKLFKIK